MSNPLTIEMPGSHDLPGELASAARRLGSALEAYNAQSAAADGSPESRAMVHGFHRVLTLALPHAPVDLLESMIELCAMETARARLEMQADNGTLPGARIVAMADTAPRR
jgi:hypothetical protein